MEKSPELGPDGTPPRPNARSAAQNRKPQPDRKPPVKRSTTAKPAVQPKPRSTAKPKPRTPAKPRATRAVTSPPAPKPETTQLEQGAVAEVSGAGETVDDAPVEASAAVTVEAPAAVAVEAVAAPEAQLEPSADRDTDTPSEASDHLVVSRLVVPRLSVPTLSRVAPPSLSVTQTAVESDVGADAAHEIVETPAEVAKESAVTVAKEPEVTVAPKSAVTVVKESAVTPAAGASVILRVKGLSKKFDDVIAVERLDLEVPVGSMYGIVGPNGAGKTTTLSMITGLLRPDSGSVNVHGADVWSDPVVAKRNIGVLPDRLRLFDRLTGSQVLYYAGILRGLDAATVRKRSADLAGAFGLEDAMGRLVTDYSAGMSKKIALAAAMIHSPRLLVLDEPFESVDPVSAATVTEILRSYVEFGGTVLLSSHSMDFVQRICDRVAVIVGGVILADGTMAAVRNGRTLEERFVELAGDRKRAGGLEWLHSFSD